MQDLIKNAFKEYTPFLNLPIDKLKASIDCLARLPGMVVTGISGVYVEHQESFSFEIDC